MVQSQVVDVRLLVVVEATAPVCIAICKNIVAECAKIPGVYIIEAKEGEMKAHIQCTPSMRQQLAARFPDASFDVITHAPKPPKFGR